MREVKEEAEVTQQYTKNTTISELVFCGFIVIFYGTDAIAFDVLYKCIKRYTISMCDNFMIQF